MDRVRNAMVTAVECLEALEATLVGELESNEAWRALRQLDEREAAGQRLETVDSVRLRQMLEEKVDATSPAWQALHTTRRTIAGLQAEAARIERHATATVERAVQASTGHDTDRPRIKIKATSAALAGPADEAGAKTDPRFGSGSGAETARPTSPAAAPSGDGARAPIPAPPRSRADLARLRSLVEARRAHGPTVARTGPAPAPTLISTPPLAADPPSAFSTPTKLPDNLEDSGMSRLSALEADLDSLIGRDRSARVSKPGADDEREVEEAEVEIVARRRIPEIEPEPATRPPRPAAPVALSIRLKQPEHEAEFDGEHYDAYRSDVEEAEVEIIRPESSLRQPAPLIATEVPRPETAGRLLRFRSRE